jgi:hypothetical protein
VVSQASAAALEVAAEVITMASTMSRVSREHRVLQEAVVTIDSPLSRVGEVPGKSRVDKV